MNISTIAFDLGHTLVEYEGMPLSWEKHYPAALRALAATQNIDLLPGQIEAGCAILRRHNTRLHPRTHEITFADIVAELSTGWQHRFDDPELKLADAFFRPFRQTLRCFADTLPCLLRLRERGCRVGVFTDVPYGMPRELVLADLAETGLTTAIDHLLTSREIGHRKPSPQTLFALAQAMGCTPAHRMVYVGNEPKDIAAARAFGCVGILLDRADTRADHGQTATITSLSQITPLLDALP